MWVTLMAAERRVYLSNRFRDGERAPTWVGVRRGPVRDQAGLRCGAASIGAPQWAGLDPQRTLAAPQHTRELDRTAQRGSTSATGQEQSVALTVRSTASV